MLDTSHDYDNAHLKAKILLHDEFYYSYEDDNAPFGTDTGADSYAHFIEWRYSNQNSNLKECLLQLMQNWRFKIFDFNSNNVSEIKSSLKTKEVDLIYLIDTCIIAIAFGQLYKEGTIEKEFKQLAKIAIERELEPELLEHSGDEIEREKRLKELLTVLQKVQ